MKNRFCLQVNVRLFLIKTSGRKQGGTMLVGRASAVVFFQFVSCENTTVVATAKPPPSKATKQVCFPHVGCFNNAPPFDNAHDNLPHSPEVVGTQFLLYTRSNWNDTYFVNYTEVTSLQNSMFNASLPIKFVIHGFSNTINTTWLYEMKDELLKKDPMNVIIVAWGPGAFEMPLYDQPVANTRVVAKQIFIVIQNMVSLGASYDKIHLIGHSLGAHTSGYVGQLLKKENKTLARISALDPAEPDFQKHPISVRVDKNDADFVDVIHTNGDPFSKGGAGMIDPCGDVDFYVNGGKKQPDCPDPLSGIFSHISDLFSGNTESIATIASCSHSRSHAVFKESINSLCPFTAYPCDKYERFQNGECLSCGKSGCGTMGYYADFSANGKFYFNTREAEPFCGHHYVVRAMISAKTQGTKGKLKVQVNGTWGASEWLSITRTKNDNLQKGASKNRVVVTEGIIGQIMSINVQYTKAPGNMIGIGKGADNLKLHQIEVVDGENGEEYTFCTDVPIHSGSVSSFPVEHSCPVE